MNRTEPIHPIHRFLLLLLIVLGLRILIAFIIWKVSGTAGFLTPDSRGYIELAQSLTQGSFSSSGLPEIFRTPGYPVFLVPAVAVQHLVAVGLFENFLLVALTAWLIWRIANDLLPGSNAGTWAVLLYCIEPVTLLHSEKLLSETLFGAELLLFLWFWLRFLRTTTYASLFLAAAALACATYTRPVGIYLGIAFIPLLIVLAAKSPLRSRIIAGIAFVLVFLLVLSPWFVRNVKVAGYKGFATVSNWNLYFMSAAVIQSKLEHRSFLQVTNEWGNDNPERYFQMHPEQRTWSQAEIADFWGTEARRILSQHGVLYVGIHARGCAVVLFDPQVTELLKPLRLYPEYGGLLSHTLDRGFFQSILWLLREYPIAGILFPLLMVQIVAYYVLAIAGLRLLPANLRWCFVSIVLYFIVVSGFPAATGRYRAPIMPLVCICAALAVGHWRSTRRLNRSPVAVRDNDLNQESQEPVPPSR